MKADFATIGSNWAIAGAVYVPAFANTRLAVAKRFAAKRGEETSPDHASDLSVCELQPIMGGAAVTWQTRRRSATWIVRTLRVRLALRSLRRIERRVYLLTAVDGLDYAAAADRLGITAIEVEEALASALAAIDRWPARRLK